MPSTTYTVRDIATGSVQEGTCFDRSNLAERVRKSQFDGLLTTNRTKATAAK